MSFPIGVLLEPSLYLQPFFEIFAPPRQKNLVHWTDNNTDIRAMRAHINSHDWLIDWLVRVAAVTDVCNINISRLFSPELNRTMALRQLYSAESTRNALSFSTWSWNTRMWSMKATTRSAAIGLAWSPAAARSGATWSGMEHCAALSTNSSLHASRNSATWRRHTSNGSTSTVIPKIRV